MSPLLTGVLASGISGHLSVTGNLVSLQTVTVGSGGASSITFSSIPQTYTHLQIRGIARSTYNTGGSTSLIIQPNGNSTISNYSVHLMDGNGSSLSVYGASGDYPQSSISNATTTSGIFGAAIIDILDYTNTNKYKTIRALGGNDNNGSGTIRFSSGALYSDTNAITSITLLSGASASLTQYSTFALYGVK